MMNLPVTESDREDFESMTHEDRIALGTVVGTSVVQMQGMTSNAQGEAARAPKGHSVSRSEAFRILLNPIMRRTP